MNKQVRRIEHLINKKKRELIVKEKTTRTKNLEATIATAIYWSSPVDVIDFETSRNGQLHLLAEQRDREYADQETFFRMSKEVVEELMNALCSDAKLREEARADEISQRE